MMFQQISVQECITLEILPPCHASGRQMHHVTRYCIGFSNDGIAVSVLIIVLAYVWMGEGGGSGHSSESFAQLLLSRSVKELVGVFRQPPPPPPPPPIQTPPHLLYCHYRNMSKIHIRSIHYSYLALLAIEGDVI